MVGSAGNSGDIYYVNGDPNIANSAISVASSVSDFMHPGRPFIPFRQQMRGLFAFIGLALP
jgi:hypothetical protein